MPKFSADVVHLQLRCTAAGAAGKLDFLTKLIRSEVNIAGSDSERAEDDLVAPAATTAVAGDPPSAAKSSSVGRISATSNRAMRRAHLARLRKHRAQLVVVVRAARAGALHVLLQSVLGTAGGVDNDGEVALFDANQAAAASAAVATAAVLVMPFESLSAFANICKQLCELDSSALPRQLVGAVLFDMPPTADTYAQVVTCVGMRASSSSSRLGALDGKKGKVHVVVDDSTVTEADVGVLAAALSQHGAVLPGFLAAPKQSSPTVTPPPVLAVVGVHTCLLYTSPSPRDRG